jgi:hypothetical protein
MKMPDYLWVTQDDGSASHKKVKDDEPVDEVDNEDSEERRKAEIKARLARMGAVSMMPGARPMIPHTKQVEQF